MRVLKVLLAMWLVQLCLAAAEEKEFEITPEEEALITFSNKQREQHGLAALKASGKLFEAARKHSANMAKQQILSHTLGKKSVEDRVRKGGYKYFTVGENIGWNEPSPEAMVDAWMNSPGHRENILNKNFTEIGVAIVKDDQDQPYYTQVFGRPQSDGATAQAKFTIINKSTDAIRVQLPGRAPESVLQPDERAMYTIAGTEIPPVTIRNGESKRALEVKDGATYEVGASRSGIEVKAEVEAAR